MKIACAVLFVLLAASRSMADGSSYTVTLPGPPGSPVGITVSNLGQYTRDLDEKNAALLDMPHTKDLIDGTLARALNDKDKPRPYEKDFVCIVHVLRWKYDSNNKRSVDKQTWWVYSNEGSEFDQKTTPPNLVHMGTWALENFSGTRIMGHKKIYFVYVHLNADPDGSRKVQDEKIAYTIEIKKKTPAYLANLFGLAQLFNMQSAAGGAMKASDAVPSNLWGAGEFEVQYSAADITITPSMDGVDTKASAKTFDDEGKYFLDFSVAVPIRNISQLSFNSTDNTVTASKIQKENLFALLNVYLPKVDIKTNNFSWIPHFIGGVAIAHQPLRKVLIGAGWGPYFAQFYIGALWVKQEQLKSLMPGQTATASQLNSDLVNRYKAQVAFGLNLPVGAVAQKLKGSQK